eukprot:CAMPEP_0180784358 /NCGR_PEP_ID=MMETSP1038_2-20121128/49552_1 /TAXON_ID=632150 /ORGANISM="Azadinium spinosum, Strain 3D9" /LENGTH=359 /DNA_ID=CAMNT_0022821063 /DNA_START=35 /DNA_END=1111 /DNA_ORIENTATION=+
MSVTSYDGAFGKKQEQIVRNGHEIKASGRKMTKEEYERFKNSPAMQSQARFEDACSAKTSKRDKMRMQTDKSFKPSESDWTASKAYDFDIGVDYYRTLGVDEYETQENIKKAYKRLSLVYHPDKTAGMDHDKAEEHKQIFIQINTAYLVLGDNATRRQYDKKRDDAVVAEELLGIIQKKLAQNKQKEQFDAFKFLEELAEKKPKPSETVEMKVSIKLEKMFYGGVKVVERVVKRETFEGFINEEKYFEVVVPAGCKENHGVMRKRIGDHQKDRKPDNINFRFKSKKHLLVTRDADNIKLKSPLKLPVGAVNDPYISGKILGIGGRVLLLFGRNPFYGIHKNGPCYMKVAVRGEAFGVEG